MRKMKNTNGAIYSDHETAQIIEKDYQDGHHVLVIGHYTDLQTLSLELD